MLTVNARIPRSGSAMALRVRSAGLVGVGSRTNIPPSMRGCDLYSQPQPFDRGFKTSSTAMSSSSKNSSDEKKFDSSPHQFPDFIEKWGKKNFYRFGGGLAVVSGSWFGYTVLVANAFPVGALALCACTGVYWVLGLKDINQKRSAIRANFPLLGNMRYIFEILRPEIRQYFIESDDDATPYARSQRSIAYSRAKDQVSTLPFGTRRNVYSEGYEWANHSAWPVEVPEENMRVTIGGPDCKLPYRAALLNVSAMSFGALSANAVLALNEAASIGGFYHNTGEGGISRYHLQPGGDLVWNIGTGYFACRTPDGKFDPQQFKERAALRNVKMIEIKLSQGAKPGHGGILPFGKLTPTIAEARGIDLTTWGERDVCSPLRHSAFSGPHGLIEFVGQLRELSGGKPIGMKMCVGSPVEFAAVVKCMLELDITPDFITVDGGEGGTGAAPPEFSNSVGTPLVEGLTLVDQILRGAGLRHRVKIIASGKVLSGFSLVRNLAIGADLCNSARAMMFALGCVQALKCNTNRCPTGVTTQDEDLMAGLDPQSKALRVARYQQKTIESAAEIIGSMGLEHPEMLRPYHIFRRVSMSQVMTFEEMFPKVTNGALRDGTAPAMYQQWWNYGGSRTMDRLETMHGGGAHHQPSRDTKVYNAH